mmetsp:Transcript_18124/g.46004  ORF Transcript_18124/g.46004 Transcript_18124/m.46004 type:complete len:209 (-) Transcript_18124:15-641(-)
MREDPEVSSSLLRSARARRASSRPGTPLLSPCVLWSSSEEASEKVLSTTRRSPSRNTAKLSTRAPSAALRRRTSPTADKAPESSSFGRLGSASLWFGCACPDSPSFSCLDSQESASSCAARLRSSSQVSGSRTSLDVAPHWRITRGGAKDALDNEHSAEAGVVPSDVCESGSARSTNGVTTPLCECTNWPLRQRSTALSSLAIENVGR